MRITDTHVFFYGDTFSNWHHTHRQFSDPLNGGLTFYSTEAAFMWQKAVFFQDLKVAAQLEEPMHPHHCKALGKQITPYDDASWACVRLGLMQYVNLLKYRQNPAMLDELLETGDRVIVEASPTDRIWGIGLAVDDPLVLDPVNWRGTNLLGEALMTVRTLLRKTT